MRTGYLSTYWCVFHCLHQCLKVFSVQVFHMCHLFYPNHSLVVGIISNAERLSNLFLVTLAVSMYIWGSF